MPTQFRFGRFEEALVDTPWAEALLGDARLAAARLATTPVDHILRVLVAAGRLWADPNYGPRVEALARLPGQVGFSPEMVEQELLGLTMALSRPYLEGKLAAELGAVEALDAWRPVAMGGLRKASPLGVTLHVASGNVSTTGVLSAIEGLLTKNAVLLKVASAAPELPLAFAKTLVEVEGPDGPVAGALAVLQWSGRTSQAHQPFQVGADAIVVWGGDEVVATYKQGLGPNTKLIVYGPRVSMAFVDADHREGPALAATAKALARDVALWDQNACSSPQVAYVEADSPEQLQPLLHALAEALERIAQELPMGVLDLHEQAEITKERELAISDELMGQGQLLAPAHQKWTLVVRHDSAFELSPLLRTLILKPVPSLEGAIQGLKPWRSYLQSAILAVQPARWGPLAEALRAEGCLRVVPAGGASGGFPGEPHDGLIGLGELVKWVGLTPPPERFDGAWLTGSDAQAATAWAKRKRLVEELLPEAPHYRQILGAKPSLPDEAAWLSLPLLDKEALAANTPPLGQGLLTQSPENGHWLRTGGSTGSPKLSIYSFADYEADMARAARGAHAAGLRPGDKVANLFFTGDLYGSFLSLNRALELVGCNAFSLTQTAPTETVLGVLEAHQVGTVIGLSSHVQAVLHDAMKAPERYAVRQVLYAGEPFHPKERELLFKGLGVQRVASIGYGGVDAGPMGFQCPHCEGDVHHLHADHVHYEILDAEGRPVGPGVTGEAVVTSLNRRLMPLLRYRMGDLARWVQGLCACGDASPRFELMGRVEDRVRFAAGDVHYSAVQAVVTGFEALHSSPQLVRDDLGLLVAVEAPDSSTDREAVSALLAEALKREIPVLLEEELGFRASVQAPRSLERVGRTGKILRVIDRRTGGS